MSVPKAAQGRVLKFTPKPAFWFACPLKVAMNSTVLPEQNRLLVPVRAPSSVMAPCATVPTPPVCHKVMIHWLGTLVPPNSAPRVGSRITSPFSVSLT